MKAIIVKWVPEKKYGYEKAMRVIESDHPRFQTGTRFDFGFFNIATDDGYVIISIPMADQINKKQCPECAQNKASGMNFCAFCGRQLWDREG